MQAQLSSWLTGPLVALRTRSLYHNSRTWSANRVNVLVGAFYISTRFLCSTPTIGRLMQMNCNRPQVQIIASTCLRRNFIPTINCHEQSLAIRNETGYTAYPKGFLNLTACLMWGILPLQTPTVGKFTLRITYPYVERIVAIKSERLTNELCCTHTRCRWTQAMAKYCTTHQPTPWKRIGWQILRRKKADVWWLNETFWPLFFASVRFAGIRF